MRRKQLAKPGAGRRLRRIAFFAPTGSEHAERMLQGILRYQVDRGGCVVREFRYEAWEPDETANWVRRARPWESWAPDGLVVHITDDPVLLDWVGAGGEPVINTTGTVKMRCVCFSAQGAAA